MGYRHRNMYKITGLPGWVRFGYSPGWVGRSPNALPPTAQWLTESGLLPKYMEWLQQNPTQQGNQPANSQLTKEQEQKMLEQQIKILEANLANVNKRIEELWNKQTIFRKEFF